MSGLKETFVVAQFEVLWCHMEESDVVNVLYPPSFNSGSGLAASRKVHALACQVQHFYEKGT